MAYPQKVINSGSDLFKWKRREPLVRKLQPPRQKKSNVQDWVKRVQAASDEAAREAFGGDIPGIGDFNTMYPDDEAVYEAQELLDSWMKDQKLEDLNCELDLTEENWSSRTRPILNSEKYLNDYGTDDLNSYTLSETGKLLKKADLDKYRHRKRIETDAYLGSNSLLDEDLDDEFVVQDILQDLMGKQLVKEDILNDLGMEKLTKNFTDPTPKMEQRHKLVKDRSQARREKLQKDRKEDLLRKEVHNLAKQKVIEEEKAKKRKVIAEEQAIQREMARIKKEMEEEKRRNKEEQERRSKLLRDAKEQMYLEEKECQEKAEKDERRRKVAEEKMRRAILREAEEKTLIETAKNLKLLNKYFSAWYGVVLEQRVKMGKARAVSDWRCKLRAWNAWKAYVSHIKSSKEAEAIAVAMKEKYRKEQMVVKHHRLKVLRRNFLAWQLWVRSEQARQATEDEHRKKATKMAAFLEAAATGKLWNTNATLSKETSNHASELVEAKTAPNTERQVDDIFKSEKFKRNNTAKAVVPTPFVPEQDNLKPPKAKNVWNENMVSPRRPGQKKPSNQESKPSNKHQVQSDISTSSSVKKSTGVSSNFNTKHTQKELNQDSKRTVHVSDTDMTRNANVALKTVDNVVEKLDSEDLRLENLESSRSNSTEFETGTVVSTSAVSRKATLKSNKPVTKPVSLGKLQSKTTLSSNERARKMQRKRATTDLNAPNGSRDIPFQSQKVEQNGRRHFLAMEERAKQRAERKAIIEEKKRQQELKRLEELRMKEEKRILQEMEEKQERIRKKKEEKRQERQRELEKQQRQEEYRHNCEIADKHYSMVLLRKYGMEPWRRLVKIANLNHQISGKYHQRNLLRTVLHSWKIYTQNIREEKEILAEECFQRILLKRCFLAFKKYRHHMDKLEVVARRYFESHLVRKYFKAWQDFVTDEEILMWSKEQKADEHNEIRMFKTCYLCWRRFCILSKEEKLQEKRRDELRKKVRGWLPDFQGLSQLSSPSNN